jgi:hypothetical protein
VKIAPGSILLLIAAASRFEMAVLRFEADGRGLSAMFSSASFPLPKRQPFGDVLFKRSEVTRRMGLRMKIG